MTSNDKELIVSDGSDNLYFYNPDTFQRVKQIKVTFQGQSFTKLNELEWIDNLVWANRLESDCIVGINPDTGKIQKIVVANSHDFRNKLIDELILSNSRQTILNGIAFDRDANRTFITGKMWPVLFQVDFVQQFDQDTFPGTDPYWTVVSMCI
eukprot:TRINITY_DN28134_c0_g1_i1.p4 TRINITY_DN28134_c0_g1~~TRINITY_DN28134_c0_g1_i1.p4  ORF type:complete len:153 (-),score=9.06 TRINITY_DN28134_c0_g1_i1:209-667(-)